MSYVLIFIFIASQKASSATAEFNDLASCRAAAAELQKQASNYPTTGSGPGIVLCAAKGAKP